MPAESSTVTDSIAEDCSKPLQQFSHSRPLYKNSIKLVFNTG